jgi:hypothetical protein
MPLKIPLRKYRFVLSDSELTAAGDGIYFGENFFADVLGIGQIEFLSGCEMALRGEALAARCRAGTEMATADDPLSRDAVFEPDATHAMAAAFDEICRAMELPESAIVPREVVAMRVIELARDGVLDPMLLRERVLDEVRAARFPFDDELKTPSMWP